IVSRMAAALAKDRSIQMITAASVFAPGDDVTNPNVVKVVLNRAGDALYFSRSAIPFVRDPGNGKTSTQSAKERHVPLATRHSPLATQRFRHQGIYGYTTK